jgi:putative addiction module component (TIGR02574 family)
MTGLPFDFSTLSPVERIVLADTLIDSAMQEIDVMGPQLTPEQLAEIDRRIADIDAGRVELLPWDEVYQDLMRGQ